MERKAKLIRCRVQHMGELPRRKKDDFVECGEELQIERESKKREIRIEIQSTRKRKANIELD